jgi:hypothetical protein
MFKLKFQAQLENSSSTLNFKFDLKFQVKLKVSISTDILVCEPIYDIRHIVLIFLNILRFDPMTCGLEDHDAIESAKEPLKNWI